MPQFCPNLTIGCFPRSISPSNREWFRSAIGQLDSAGKFVAALGLGDIVDAFEVWNGVDAFTGEDLSTLEWAVAALLLAVPLVNSSAGRQALKKVLDILEGALERARRCAANSSVTRKLGELVERVRQEFLVFLVDESGAIGWVPRLLRNLKHYSESTDGIRLWKTAKEYAKKNADSIDEYSNIMIVEYKTAAGTFTMPFVNVKGVAHSEYVFYDWYKAQKENTEILRIFTERKPCGANSADCDTLLSHLFGEWVEVFYEITKGPIPR